MISDLSGDKSICNERSLLSRPPVMAVTLWRELVPVLSACIKSKLFLK